MAGAGFDVVDLVHGSQVEGIGGEAVERVGWHAQDFPRPDLVGGILHERGFGRIRTDFYDFGAHGAPSVVTIRD